MIPHYIISNNNYIDVIVTSSRQLLLKILTGIVPGKLAGIVITTKLAGITEMAGLTCVDTRQLKHFTR